MQSKTQLCHRLAAARQWLHQAEESFGKKQEVQGELNLFLAQAELQHVREGRKLPFWLQPRWGWQSMAMVFAVLLALSAGAGMFWAKQNEMTVLAPAASIAAPAVKSQLAEAATERPVMPPATSAPAPAAAGETALPAAAPRKAEVLPRERQGETKETSQAVEAETVSPQEMQKALRAAGKALRGVGQ